jgi:hypothetical protein
MLKQVVIGHSSESYEKAIGDGIEKASRITAGMTNPHVALIELSYHESSGYRAKLEISKEVMGMHENFNLIEQFEEKETEHAARYREMLRVEHERFHQMVISHFIRLGQMNVNFYIPDFILVPLTGGDIENNWIERKFANATITVMKPSPEPQPVKKSHGHQEELEPE